MERPRGTPTAIFSTLILIAALCGVFATDPPDSQVNPVSGYIETVSSTQVGSNYEIRHVIDPGEGGPTVVATFGHSGDDEGPRISISSAGNTGVTWWHDAATDAVHYRWREEQTGDWSSIHQVSESNESSRNPEIIHDGYDYWIVFEFDQSGGNTGIGVNGIRDDPDPITSRTVIGSTPYGSDLDSSIHHDSGYLWATWIHSATQVGWSQYDDSEESWSTASYESYESDNVAAARGRIRSEIVGE